MSRHGKKRNSRARLAAVAAAGALAVGSAATATALTWPGSSARLTAAHQYHVQFALKADQAKAAGTARQAASRAAMRKAAAAKAVAAARAAAARKAAARQAASAAAARQAASAAAASGTPEQIAQAMLSQFGWSASQYSCLYPLWQRESNWEVGAYNPGSGAYGIPQALPGSKMASAGPDWQTSAYTQIKWGLTYIRDVYGSPCAAWSHEEADGWY